MRILLRHPETEAFFVCYATLVTYLMNEKKLCITSSGYIFKVAMSAYTYDNVMRQLFKDGYADLSSVFCEVENE